jgi:pimeloyl-ACP methyl ester carboxylesterase
MATHLNTLQHEGQGRGEIPVLLMHGWGGSFESTWVSNGWIEALERAGRSYLCVDLPGHGSKPASEDPKAYGDLAGLVEARVVQTGPIDIIGYSLGAKVALELAARRPAQVRSLVLGGIGGNVFAPEASAESVAVALDEGVSDLTPPSVRALVDYARQSGGNPHAMAAVLRRPANPVFNKARLSLIRTPALLICGDQDLLAMPVTPLLDALPHVTHQILRSIDHLGLPSNRQFRRLAIQFLAEDRQGHRYDFC